MASRSCEGGPSEGSDAVEGSGPVEGSGAQVHLIRTHEGLGLGQGGSYEIHHGPKGCRQEALGTGEGTDRIRPQ